MAGSPFPSGLVVHSILLLNKISSFGIVISISGMPIGNWIHGTTVILVQDDPEHGYSAPRPAGALGSQRPSRAGGKKIA